MGVDRKRKTYQVGWSPKIRLPIGVKFRSRRLNHPADVFFLFIFSGWVDIQPGPPWWICTPMRKKSEKYGLIKGTTMVNNPLFFGLVCHGGTCTMGAPVDWPWKKIWGKTNPSCKEIFFTKISPTRRFPVIPNLRMGVSLDPQTDTSFFLRLFQHTFGTQL